MIPIATVEDFIQSFNDDEAAELSHLNLPTDPTIAYDKIQFQLNRAAKTWLGWFGFIEYSAAPVECSSSAMDCEIAIARKRMDFNNPREAVTADYEFCYTLARDWKRDQIDKAKIPGGETIGDEPVMSIFTI